MYALYPCFPKHFSSSGNQMSKYDIASRVCQYGNGSRFIWLDVISFLTTQTHANFNSNEPFTWFHWCAHEMRPFLSISFWIFLFFFQFWFLVYLTRLHFRRAKGRIILVFSFLHILTILLLLDEIGLKSLLTRISSSDHCL